MTGTAVHGWPRLLQHWPCVDRTFWRLGTSSARGPPRRRRSQCRGPHTVTKPAERHRGPGSPAQRGPAPACAWPLTPASAWAPAAPRPACGSGARNRPAGQARPLWTAMHGLGSLGLLAGLLPPFLHMHGEEAGGARGTADAHPPWPGHAGGRCLAVWGGSREPSGSWRAREARSSGQVRSGAFLKSQQMEPGPPVGRGGTACRMGPAEPGVGVLTLRSPAASGGGCVAAAGRAGRQAPGHGAGGKAGPAPSWPRLACQASFPRGRHHGAVPGTRPPS